MPDEGIMPDLEVSDDHVEERVRKIQTFKY